ncbi:MAG: hypothetical protein AB7O24_14395 [Kofleriaceae bacterium]
MATCATIAAHDQHGVGLINAPGMTSRGKQVAFIFACIAVFLLPKRVDCGFPGGRCGRYSRDRTMFCTTRDLEPLGFFLIEQVAERNVGFAYAREETCR